MMHVIRAARAAAFAALLALGLGQAGPAMSQAQVNPTELSVNETMLLEALSEDGKISGRVSIPDQSAADLVKPGGREWRETHNETVFNVVVWSAVAMLVLLALFFLLRGRIRLESGFSGRPVLRFNAIERFAHWLVAVPFILLALTGLNLVVGRYVVLPVVGPYAFGEITQFGKLAHNFLAWPFMLGVAIIFALWIKDNIPSRTDGVWLRAGGGFLKKGVHPPARRFNPGQKIIFWSVVLGGIALSVTGVFLVFPALLGEPETWQLVQVIHGIVAGLMGAIIIAHIYIGTLGMEGAFSAMGNGTVDANWAREHHSLWAEKKLGERPAHAAPEASRGGVAPAE